MRIKMHHSSRFAQREDGAAAVIIALTLTVVLAFVALAVDVAMLYRARAALQAKADIIALSAVPDLPQAQSRADSTLAKNQPAAIRMDDPVLGRYVRNPELEPSERFDEAALFQNALEVTLRTDSPLYFAQIFMDTTSAPISVKAMATRTGFGSFSLGSQLVKLGSLPLSEALTQSLGLEVNLNVNELSLLASTQINPRQLLEELSAGLTPLSENPAEILDRSVSPNDIIAALVAIDPSLGGALAGLALVSDAPSVSVREIVSGADKSLGYTTLDLLEDANLSAADVLSALAAPGAAGAPISLNVSAALPGVEVETALSMGEPPAESGVIAVGETGTTLHSAAARIKADITVAPGIFGPLNLGPLVSVSEINLPLYTELAGTTAELTELNCNGSSSDAIAARFSTSHTDLHPGNGSSVAALYIGNFANDPMASTSALDPSKLQFADLLDITILPALPLLPPIQVTVQARAHVALGQSQSEEISFSKGEADSAPVTKEFSSGDVLGSAASSLLNNLELRVKPVTVLGPVLSSILNFLPTALLGPIDAVLDAVLAAVNLKLGVGELTLKDHLCETPKLVQ